MNCACHAHATVNWTDAKRSSYYDNRWGGAYTSGDVPDQNGNRLDLVPAIQAAADVTYRGKFGDDYAWYAHTGPQYAEAIDIAKLSGYAHVNVSLGLTKGRYVIERFVTNLLNDKNWTYAVRFPDPTYFSVKRTRGSSPQNRIRATLACGFPPSSDLLNCHLRF